jgi:hypothetical protein
MSVSIKCLLCEQEPSPNSVLLCLTQYETKNSIKGDGDCVSDASIEAKKIACVQVFVG